MHNACWWSFVILIGRSVCKGWSLICPRELPAEWEGRAEKQELEINVEDLTEETYVPKKKAFHPFSGRGYRLGR